MRNLLLIFVIISVLATGCGPKPAQITEQDTIAIYEAVIRQVFLVDDTGGGTIEKTTLYIVRATDDAAGDPSMERSDTAILSDTIQKAITNELADLPTKVVWVDNFDQVELNSDSMVRGEGVILTLGNIKVTNSAEVLVSASIYFASLGAGGRTYIVEKINGVWTVTGDTGVIWVS
ncbi:MAG: hypothetical protein HY867_04385 [Chloroflexi bacterium]|nr:hypothetical protein [Chloroflexota bacterium]